MSDAEKLSSLGAQFHWYASVMGYGDIYQYKVHATQPELGYVTYNEEKQNESLQWQWRLNPPKYPETDGIEHDADISNWHNDCMIAILDALLIQGQICAWSGDGTACVAQIIEAFARRERDLLKRIKELENEHKES